MKKKVTFVIDEEVARQLKIAAAIHSLNQSAIVETSITKELDRLAKQGAKQGAKR